MVLPLVSCWWCSLLLLLSRERNNQPLQSVVKAGSGWRRERHRLNSGMSLSQACLPMYDGEFDHGGDGGGCGGLAARRPGGPAVAAVEAVEDNDS